ncbi:MAG: hypothetical protein ABIO65_10430 [Nitrospiria bacterium]
MAIEGNHLSEGACYQNRDARDIALVRVLRVAHKLFAEASVIQNLDRLQAIRAAGFPIEDIHALAMTFDPPFLDAFKIATSFENLFKAELIAFGHVVHKIDKRARGGTFRTLAEQQTTRPIRLSELRKLEGTSWRRQGQFTIVGLTHETLTLGQLTNQNNRYRQSLRLSQQVLSALKFVRQQRNTVHFVVNDIGSFGNCVVDWYLCLRAAMNRRLLPRYQAIINKYDHLRGSAQWHLQEI